MNQSLDLELMPPPRILTNLSSVSSLQDQTYIKKFKADKGFKHLKCMLTIIMCLMFMSYRLFWKVGLDQCIRDLGHYYTTTLNRLINDNELFYQVVMVIAQQSIQINIFCLCLLYTWKVKNLRAHFFLCLFYGIRGILLNIERFPYPPYIRWDAPVVPSFTVPYGITRDYFYSGHTGLMLFSTFEWKRMGIKWLYYPNLVLTPFVVMVLLSTRVHYSIDIIAATIFTFWLQRHVSKYVYWFDRVWSFILEKIREGIQKIRRSIAQ